jgi:hypothetical protein
MSRISLASISNTPPKQIKVRDKNSITQDDIAYLDLHAEMPTNGAPGAGGQINISKAHNQINNSKREALIEFIFRMKSNNLFLKHPRWSHWYVECNKIKELLQTMYKTETGETNDGTFHIRQRGGSKYSYDFAVRITNADKTKRAFIPLEYKHQSSLGVLPQFYQVGNVSKPFFDVPYHEYYYTNGLPKVNKVIGVDIKLESSDKDIYAKIIGKSVWTKNDWEKMKREGLSTCAPINEQLRIIRENYEEKGDKYKEQQMIVTETIIEYFKEMEKNGGITLDLINQVEESIFVKQKPRDHNNVPKDKVYLLCEYTDGDLHWKTDQYASGDFVLVKEPSRVVVENERLLFPTMSDQHISLRLRWQNVSGLCNPSWQFDVKTDAKKSKNKTVKTDAKNSKNKTVKTTPPTNFTSTRRSTETNKSTFTRCPNGTRRNHKTGKCEPK